MGNHAMGFSPIGLSAGPLGKMAEFRFDDAAVTTRKPDKTRIAVPLREGLLDFSVTADAADSLFELEPEGLFESRVEGHVFTSQWQRIANRLPGSKFSFHLSYLTLHVSPFLELAFWPMIEAIQVGRHTKEHCARRRGAFGRGAVEKRNYWKESCWYSKTQWLPQNTQKETTRL